MVSIHRPLGYGPSTLPLRHAALLDRNDEKVYSWEANCEKHQSQSRCMKKVSPNKGLEPLTLRLKV